MQIITDYYGRLRMATVGHIYACRLFFASDTLHVGKQAAVAVLTLVLLP